MTISICHIYGNLTPCIPLSLKGEGEEIFRRGTKSLLNSLNVFEASLLPLNQGCLRGALAPLFKYLSPFPLIRGRGIKGDGVTQ